MKKTIHLRLEETLAANSGMVIGGSMLPALPDIPSHGFFLSTSLEEWVRWLNALMMQFLMIFVVTISTVGPRIFVLKTYFFRTKRAFFRNCSALFTLTKFLRQSSFRPQRVRMRRSWQISCLHIFPNLMIIAPWSTHLSITFFFSGSVGVNLGPPGISTCENICFGFGKK